MPTTAAVCFKRFQYNEYDWDSFTPRNYCVIPLTKGYFAVVSPQDYERVSRYKWCANVQTSPNDPQCVIKVYACRRTTNRERSRGAPRIVYLHRYLTRVMYAGRAKVVDHKNGDSLDCRRCNLRVINQSGNISNCISKKRPVNFDTPRGVKPVKFRCVTGEVRVTSWKGRICVNGKTRYSQPFSSPERAHRWYVRMHRILHPPACSWRELGTVPELILPPLRGPDIVSDVPF